jgi:ferrochelatase
MKNLEIYERCIISKLRPPESPTPKDVKPLFRSLMDKYVIDVQERYRSGGIIYKQDQKISRSYAKNLVDEGSPLVVVSKRMHKKVQQQVDIPVVLAMRYGNPSMLSGLQKIKRSGCY